MGVFFNSSSQTKPIVIFTFSGIAPIPIEVNTVLPPASTSDICRTELNMCFHSSLYNGVYMLRGQKVRRGVERR